MTIGFKFHRRVAGLLAVLALVFSLLVSTIPAQAQSGHPMLGGPRGVVKSTKGDPLEGIELRIARG